MHNNNYTWLSQRDDLHRLALHVPSTTLKLHGMSTGCYTVRWFDCTRGDWLANTTGDRVCSDEEDAGDLHLATPPFETNLAAKVAWTVMPARSEDSAYGPDEATTRPRLKADDVERAERLDCFDPVDSTSCLQAALNSKAEHVLVPNTGQPWISRPLFANSSDMVISLEPGVVIEARRGSFHGFWDSMISFCGVRNVTLRGLAPVRGGPLANESDIATLRMHKEDYRNKTAYPEISEFRMGIWVGDQDGLGWTPPSNTTAEITLEHLRVESSGGDGVFLNTGSRNITVKGVDSADHYRQGMSVCDATNLWVEGCWFRDTEGTDPMAG